MNNTEGQHHHHHPVSSNKLLLTIMLNFFITAAEIVGGIISNSLSLMSDALHNLSDAVALLLAYIAQKISRKKSTESKTFGYKRIEILAAFINSIVLIVVCIYLFVEAFHRLMHPEPVRSLIMITVALIGLLANLASVLLLKKDSSTNLNIRAAYLHLIGDTMSSFAVITGGILVYFFSAYWIDPLITFLIGIYIIKETWDILKQSVNILMQSTPSNINMTEIKHTIEQIPQVENIHHVHIWNLDDRQTHFECHIDLRENLHINETEGIKREIEQILKERFQINHFTIQFEYNWCEDKKLV